ncbi:mannose-6-phosphate isomerase [Tribonema minus]|uniref:mannose-6-phosphate isomerase n=1 Tax=Tribonema minus TaxID=303371 RepID=A0A835YY41_9STRA|nr:mannose-6-phosphate isomerase [Tribonema minus]
MSIILPAAWQVQEDENYAELWMGTHPNGPSRVAPEDSESSDDGDAQRPGMFLIELLETNPSVLGDLEEVGDLPFMFKILSIAKALSIQAHPDKQTAEKLYASRPDLYRDDNHKPEMAVALSEFEGLCGFRPFHEMVYSLHRYPELRGVVSLAAVKAILDVPEDIGRQQAALHKLFVSYMKAKPAVIRTQLRLLDWHTGFALTSQNFGTIGEGLWNASAEAEDEVELEEMLGKVICLAAGDGECPGLTARTMLRRLRAEERSIHKLMLRLNEEYPGDIGIMMPLLLNYLRLEPGQAFFMGANEPHAYLRGDIMEVMARSDNVVRVALTPKYRDVPLLCDILTYKMGAPPLVLPRRVSPYCLRFTPPVADFELEVVTLPHAQQFSFDSIKVPSIFLVLGGTGWATDDDGGAEKELWSGVSMFVPARCAVNFRATSTDAPLLVAVAHTNIHWRPPPII